MGHDEGRHNSAVGTRHAVRKYVRLRLITGGKIVINEERIKERIKKIIRDLDEASNEKVASLLLATYKLETWDRWAFTAVAVIAAISSFTSFLFYFSGRGLL